MNPVVHIGNPLILKNHKVAFLSSRQISSLSVLKCMDWATEQRDRGICVISGFHSPIEKDVFHFLLKGKQPIILVLGRTLYKQLPEELQKPVEEQRLLIVSPVSQAIQRQSIQSSLIRNKYIIDIADEFVFGSLNENGSLYPLYCEAKSSGKEVIRIN